MRVCVSAANGTVRASFNINAKLSKGSEEKNESKKNAL